MACTTSPAERSAGAPVALIGNGESAALYEQITIGALLLLAVGLDALSRRRQVPLTSEIATVSGGPRCVIQIT